MNYQVRFCRRDERERLLDFLRRSWSSKHVFLSNPELLDWQYLQRDRYNFVVAYHADSKEFHGVLGFISPTFFSKGRIFPDDDLWLSIWKVEKNNAESGSPGLEMLNFLRTNIPSRSLSAVGINSQVARLYRALGCHVGYMGHYYIRNVNTEEFRIARGQRIQTNAEKADQRRSLPGGQLNFKELRSSEVQTCTAQLPLDSRNRPGYLVARFADHPAYRYRFFSVEKEGSPEGLFVSRRIEVNGSSCLRIVDFVGLEGLSLSIEAAAQGLLKSEGAEYIDLMVAGMKHDQVRALGFVECDEESYVPHLFEPFDSERKQVQYAVFDKLDILILKGDSDLDRPNRPELL